MAQQIIVYWRDIPSQIIISKGRAKGKCLLSSRFQEAIDQAAMHAGMAKSNEYVEQWRRETQEIDCEGDLTQCAEAVAAALETHFTEVLLKQVVKKGGLLV